MESLLNVSSIKMERYSPMLKEFRIQEEDSYAKQLYNIAEI